MDDDGSLSQSISFTELWSQWR